MKSKNPVNFQGIIDRKLQKNKTKTKRCDRSSKQLFIHTTNTTRKQTNKKNTLTTILHPKNYRETAVLIGICVDFLSVFPKNSTRFPLNVIPEDHLLH